MEDLYCTYEKCLTKPKLKNFGSYPVERGTVTSFHCSECLRVFLVEPTGEVHIMDQDYQYRPPEILTNFKVPLMKKPTSSKYTYSSIPKWNNNNNSTHNIQ
jgi:hypothetical protein